jgi:hypothetical protein
MGDWHGIGIERVREVGMQDHFRFVEAKSAQALPQLAAEHRTFEIILIDGDHRFDGQFADFVLADNLCPQGGYLLFHDIWMPATQKLAAFIRNNRPDYVSLKTGVNIGAFQKRGEDRRNWDHFVSF